MSLPLEAGSFRQQDLKTHIESFGYTMSSIRQPTLYAVARIERGGTPFFLKSATTKNSCKGIVNESEWNKLLNTSSRHKLPVGVPSIHEEGSVDGLNFFISEYVEGFELGSAVEVVDGIEQYIPLMAQTAHAIMNLPTDIYLPKDQPPSQTRTPVGFINNVTQWQNRITQKDTSHLINYMKDRVNHLAIAPHHGDFSPRNFMSAQNNKLYLIDGELASIYGVAFYDVANCYHRLFTRHKRPDLAERFLEEFKAIHPLMPEDKERIRLLIAQRLVAGYMEAEEGDPTVDTKLQQELENQLLQGGILK